MFLFWLKRRCPNCQSTDVRRSVRRGSVEEALLPLMMLRPFRCEKCDYRFYGLFFAWRAKEHEPEEKVYTDRSTGRFLRGPKKSVQVK